ncbi:hypothetical protein M2105_005699 [Paenibacillus sp. PastF-1]|nr:hypothetical protein [Paenibacillus sp. PastF-2]MDF9851206.1 hypothetical protein [Paenibacillus sp. PastM-2]MDF9857801.1 hypothetical protein [Paenibacillus sp. PastF-1]MDH6483055.1 hypothetical protein [Paenibacillus sp. PastH-2]MDH6510481.1 hypothetical protein [Paenibacillus sp. PastM-3]
MNINRLRLLICYICVVIPLLIFWYALMDNVMAKLEITGVDGYKISTEAYTLAPDLEVLVAKDVAEQVLDARISWQE